MPSTAMGMMPISTTMDMMPSTTMDMMPSTAILLWTSMVPSTAMEHPSMWEATRPSSTTCMLPTSTMMASMLTLTGSM